MAPLLRTLVGQRNIALRPGAGDSHIRVAVADLEAIMTKLVQNSVDATADTGEITIESTRLDPEYPLQLRMLEEYGLPKTRHVRIRVADNGRGIPEENRNSIFQPFFTTKPGSLGLGLSAVHGIVKRAKGKVVFTSDIGRGTAFEILMPESTCDAKS
jgi:two-component system, cell cycle sensor histidine kinase and response regulator CckA